MKTDDRYTVLFKYLAWGTLPVYWDHEDCTNLAELAKLGNMARYMGKIRRFIQDEIWPRFDDALIYKDESSHVYQWLLYKRDSLMLKFANEFFVPLSDVKRWYAMCIEELARKEDIRCAMPTFYFRD